MHATVTARHCEIDDALRERAETIIQRLDQLTPFSQSATVVFDAEPLRQTVEIRFHLAGGQVLKATAEGDDHRTALDRAEAKLRRQLEHPSAKGGRKPRRPTPKP